MKALGIYFDDIHSFYDLDLFLAKDGVFIPPAQPKTNYVELAGGDGSLDLTEAHGEVKYHDRTGCKFTFTVNPNSDMTFDEKKTQVSNALNGKRCKIILDKDEDYYYLGRCTVNEYLSDRRILQIVVTATVSPYKYKKIETVMKFTLSSTSKTVNIRNGRKSVIPVITCSNSNTTVTSGSYSTTLNAGTHEIVDFQLKHGNNHFVVSGSGTIEFKFREGDL